ncbi:spermidine synthase [Rheinheimera sp. SA_1]|uniref:spermidine synthase n=1 Tax=Rheinheimera sp. SA_1 TaxID=1827365 RepID=UPI0012FA337C|nr:hypothetical protein [Rheinheimera sp. SA_1]
MIKIEGIVEQSDNRTQAILSWRRSATVDLRVEQDEQQRYLVLNGQRQSQMQLQHPASPTYPHLQLLLDWLANKPWQRLLQIGLGGGEFNRVLAARWPDCQVVTVEQEPLIIEAYQQFFRPQPHPNETLICADAMTFARDALVQPQRFEVIFIDIYPWPEQWQALMLALLQLRAENNWFCINLPAEPPAQWQQFWQQQPVKLVCYNVPGYLNQLWLGG